MVLTSGRKGETEGVLEHNNMINQYQCGFRKGRSTMDALIKCINDIEKAFVLKENVITVYFDIDKAYDTVWKEGLLIKLQNWDTRKDV